METVANGKCHDITAVEIRPDIAAVYKKYFPQDDIIIGDAHEFLLKNYKSFDFIWASPPCPTLTHGARYFAYVNNQGETVPPVYPDMTLYQENNIFTGMVFGVVCGGKCYTIL